jgi:hypothetical protein
MSVVAIVINMPAQYSVYETTETAILTDAY